MSRQKTAPMLALLVHSTFIAAGVIVVVCAVVPTMLTAEGVETHAVWGYLWQSILGSMAVALFAAIIAYCVAYTATVSSLVMKLAIPLALAVYACPYFFLIEAFKPLGDKVGALAPIVPMVLRYSPFGIILLYLHLKQSPIQAAAVRNLGKTTWKYHWAVSVRLWCLPIVVISTLFAFWMSLSDPQAVDRVGQQSWVNLGTWLYCDLKRMPEQVLVWGSLILAFEFLILGLVLIQNRERTIPSTITLPQQERRLMLCDTPFLVVTAGFCLVALWPFLAVAMNLEAWQIVPSLLGLKVLPEALTQASHSVGYSLRTATAATLFSVALSVVSISAREMMKVGPSIGQKNAMDMLMLLPLLTPPAVLAKVLPIAMGRHGLNVGHTSLACTLVLVWMYSPITYFILSLSCGDRLRKLSQQARNLCVGPSLLLRFFWGKYCLSAVMLGGLVCFAFAFNESVVLHLISGYQKNIGGFLNAAHRSGLTDPNLAQQYAAAAISGLCFFFLIAGLFSMVIAVQKWLNKRGLS
jgi:ABC-type Fe3+ transport system permease subunit